MEISKAATASTSSTSSSAVIEDYYITPDNNNNNYNDNDDEETSTTTDDDDDDSHYELYDDNSSLSTSGTEDEDHPTNLVKHHQSNNSNNNIASSSSSLDVNTSLDNLLAEEEILHEYNDGDLQTLNELVNKLHEADVARRVKLEQQQQQQQRWNNNNERRADDYEVEDYYYDEDDDDDDEDDSYSDQFRRNKPTTTRTTTDLPSEMPLHPPSFSPLLLSPTNTTNHQHGQLSISSVDSSLHGPSIEIVPTSQISSILPLWNASWMEERREWAMLCQLREEERHNHKRIASVNNNNDDSRRRRRYRMLRRNNTDLPTGGNSGDNNNTNVRRNRSEPSPRSPSTTTHHSKNRYGKPTPITTTPNPIVTKSSKKIHRRHARYALTAGMMLGVREGVGGANGVECELEAKLWEESERKEMKGGGGNDGGGSGGGGCVSGGQQQQQQPSQRVEVVMGPLKVVTSVENEHDCCGIITATVLCPQSNGRSITTATTTTNNNKHTKEDDKQAQQQQHQDDKHYHDNNYLTQQCERISKYKFSPSTFYLGSNTSEPLPHKYKFKVYAPVVFQRIRTLFGVEKQTFLHSICGKFNLYEFASNAKSGQFFFYSHDGRYMIKTLTYTEQKFLRLILPSYYRHLTRYPHTFLTHFYGLYRVCMPNADNTRLHFVIMRSVFHTEKKIDRVWDLKGSTVGRKSEEGESVAKDVDILEEGKKLRFQNGSEREAFLKQLEVDAAFLATLGIMDYSLLLGLHNGCNDACYGGVGSGSGSPVDDTTPTNSERKRLNTGDSAIGGGGVTELPMTNTPHRRNVLKRATSHGATINNNNNGSSPPKPPPPPPPPRVGGSSPTKSSPFPLSSSNPITSMPDLGIQGGTPLRPETYYCGIIDILQYYNARKMGETVIKKAAGHADNISCVDPETYGKRFVKFISDLVE